MARRAVLGGLNLFLFITHNSKFPVWWKSPFQEMSWKCFVWIITELYEFQNVSGWIWRAGVKGRLRFLLFAWSELSFCAWCGVEGLWGRARVFSHFILGLASFRWSFDTWNRANQTDWLIGVMIGLIIAAGVKPLRSQGWKKIRMFESVVSAQWACSEWASSALLPWQPWQLSLAQPFYTRLHSFWVD